MRHCQGGAIYSIVSVSGLIVEFEKINNLTTTSEKIVFEMRTECSAITSAIKIARKMRSDGKWFTIDMCSELLKNKGTRSSKSYY